MTKSSSNSINSNQVTNAKPVTEQELNRNVVALMARTGSAEFVNSVKGNQINISARSAEYAEGLEVRLFFPKLLSNSLPQVASFLAALNVSLEELEKEYYLGHILVIFCPLKGTLNSE